MLYLLDANALITAQNTWYGHRRVPEFWRWLLHHGEAGTVKLPAEIYAEVESGTDELARWMRDTATKKALLLGETSEPSAVQRVLSLYGDSLTEADLITIGQDPFLIAAALGHIDRRVVTAEVSKPKRTGARRHVPDVCSDCGVSWMNPVTFIANLNFYTGWEASM
ncbi:DUF4411 family protein [Roseococcus sp. SYP-B2431]|uniref:DUF4411 family protein n=1 Tax=Roseococcus sp. SYP-B2431 TaxID=2496640 RepID=UPI00103C3AB0|nr:DUF4411 family protein [Roseococcus sp. SYP-B2431]TCH96581.1 DUF4411 family protein [Roseococcus sp. SYP-B2431]